MRTWKKFVSGLSGAVALTAAHEGFKKLFPFAPRIDKLGMQGIKKVLGGFAPRGKKLYGLSMFTDLISNGWLYSKVAKADNPIKTGTMLGFATGISTATLPETLGLSKRLSSGYFPRTALTIFYYTFGGLVAGAVANSIRS